MPSPGQFVLPKTEDSKEFENMVKDCASICWKQEFNLYGSSGQRQHGIDIFSENWDIVIQCKNYIGDKINIKKFIQNINKDYDDAANHFKSIRCFIVATAINRNNQIQDYLRDMDRRENSKSEIIEIKVLFWEDIQNILIDNQILMNKYYNGLYKKQKIFTANSQYTQSFQEILFLHKRNRDTSVNLVNLFIVQKYKELDYKNSDTDVSKVKVNLPERLAQFIEDKTPWLFIEGNAGCGKSSLIGWLNYHISLHDNIANQIFGNRPLVTIRLRDLDKKLISSYKSLVSAILTYMNIETVDELVNVFPHAVMILDGFDELCMIEGISDYERFIYDVNSRHLNDFKFIVTVRPQYISDGIDIPHNLLTLQHFDQEQRCEWLFRYTSPEFCGQHMDPKVKEYIESIDDWTDSAICDTPMTLYMLAAKETSVEMIKNSWRLYHHIFYEELSETEYNQMFYDPNRNYVHEIVNYRDIIYRINEEIAYRMYCSKNNKFYLSSDELREIIETLSKSDVTLRNESIKLMVERCYALCTYWKERSDDGAVEFYHNNIRDFFLCEKIFRELNIIYKNQHDNRFIEMIDILSQKFCDMFKYNSLDTMVSQFILLRTFNDMESVRRDFPIIEMEHSLLPELFERMITDGTLYNNLNIKNPIQSIINILTCMAQIYRHIYEPFLHEGKLIKWWNSPEEINNTDLLKYVFSSIFKQVPVTFSGGFILNMASKSDFSAIDFHGCDLRNIGFQYSNLTETNFSDTILCGCDFSDAMLNKSDFSNSDIHYACLKNAKMDGCVLTGADLRGTDLPDGSCSENQNEQIAKMESLNIKGLKI